MEGRDWLTLVTSLLSDWPSVPFNSPSHRHCEGQCHAATTRSLWPAVASCELRQVPVGREPLFHRIFFSFFARTDG